MKFLCTPIVVGWLFAFVCLGEAPVAADEPAGSNGEFRITWDGQGELTFAQKGESNSSFELRCDGKVRIQGEDFMAQASRFTYNSAEDVLKLESSGKDEVKVLWRANDGVTARLVARQITLWPSKGSFELSQARGVVVGEDGDARDDAQAADVPLGGL